MGTAHVQEDCNPSDSHKAVRSSNKLEDVETLNPHGPDQQPSYVSREEALPDDEQRNASIIGCPFDDEGPWAGKTILSLDGGGVRGYSSLLILEQLMKMIANLERSTDPKATSSSYSRLVDCLPETHLPPILDDTRSTERYLPCHYFDYVSGTSTGGLIAIMLGRMHMNIHACIDEYERLSARVFQMSSSRLKRPLTNHDKEAKWRELEDRFNMLRPAWPSPSEGREEPVLFKSDPYRCRTLVCSLGSDLENDFQTPFLFRSYHQPRVPNPSIERLVINPSKQDNIAIYQVARATSAAPFYSKPVKLNDKYYHDAAVDLNNPSWEVVKEVCSLAGGYLDVIDVLLSVGGGNARANESGSKHGGRNLEKALREISYLIHEKVRSESKIFFNYYRLDVDEGLQDVRLNEWMPKSSGKTTIQKIREATARYLQNQEVRSQLQECAADLVKKRIQRAKTMHWERFATGTIYKCPKENCPKPALRFSDRNDLLDHLRRQHKYPPPDAAHYREVWAAVDKGRA